MNPGRLALLERAHLERWTRGARGWLKDRWGLSWQVVPSALLRAVTGPDQKKSDRVMAVMMEMKKIDLRRIEEAARGG